MLIKIVLFILTCSVAWGQAVPTEASFLDTQLGNAASGVTSQFYAVRQTTYSRGINRPILSAHHRLMSIGFCCGATNAQMNAWTDSLKAAGVTMIQVNLDMRFFVNQTTFSAQLAKLDAGLTYAAQTQGMNVELNLTYGTPGNPTFTVQACAEVPGNCTAGFFTDFPTFNTYATTLVTAVVTRFGPASILGNKLTVVSLMHEPSDFTNPNLFAVPWNGAAGVGSPADWATTGGGGFATAGTNAIRAVGAGTCPACATLETTMALVGGGSHDSSRNFAGPITANVSLGSLSLDIYSSPSTLLFTYLTTTILNENNIALLAGKPISIEETSPPTWAPGNVPTASLAYRGGENLDWQTYNMDIEYLRTMYMWAGANRIMRIALTDSTKLFLYTPFPSNATPPNPNCGNDGTQCGADIGETAPYITYMLSRFTTNAATGQVALNPVGQFWKLMTNSGLLGVN